MKYLIIDDEHELYKRMFADLFYQNKYSIEEIPRVKVPKILKPIYRLHFNERVNSHLILPLKEVWAQFYELYHYHFDSNEEYVVIFLNGSLRFHFDRNHLKEFKQTHRNVKLVMIMYDSYINPAAQRAISFIPLFDTVFSFDELDCKMHGFEHIYSTFSYPNFVKEDGSKHSNAFFIGFGAGRLEMLRTAFQKITQKVDNCKFYIAGVKKEDIIDIKDVVYNQTMSYDEELQMAYNTDCIVEIVKEGQTGISLRTCEAIAFNKKLLTNNVKLKEMPFYNQKYMSVFEKVEDIDINFIQDKIKVTYEDTQCFSPLKIIEKLERIYSK